LADHPSQEIREEPFEIHQSPFTFCANNNFFFSPRNPFQYPSGALRGQACHAQFRDPFWHVCRRRLVVLTN